MVEILKHPEIIENLEQQISHSLDSMSEAAEAIEAVQPTEEQMDTEQSQPRQDSTQDSAQDPSQDPEDMEEGELPDDDDDAAEIAKAVEKSKESKDTRDSRLPPPPKKGVGTTFSSRPLPTSKSSRYKDYDSKAAAKSSSSSSMIDSWVSGIKNKSSGGRDDGELDPNEEYYGAAEKKDVKADTEDGQNAQDVDLRMIPAAEAKEEDQDFRFVDMEALDSRGGRDRERERERERDRDYRRDEDRPDISPRRSPGGYREERRRRRSPTPDDYRSKRSRDISPPYYRRDRREREPREPREPRESREPREPRGPPENRGPPRKTRWTEHTICKFFREGYCREQDNCPYSHNAADSHRRPELCKFYNHGYCKKGLHCQLLHGEWPCKAFHKGECSKNPCMFSHMPLNEFTQPIFDQMMKDEELAAKIMIPNMPQKRRVLIPGGPDPNQPVDNPVPDPITGQIPPPKVVVPVLASQHPTYPGYDAPSATGTYGFFNPITPVVKHESSQPVSERVINAQQTASLISSILQNKSEPPVSTVPTSMPILNSILDTKPKSPQEETTGFNINQMLEKITQGVVPGFTTAAPEIDESPASPPMFDPTSVVQDKTPMLIPSSSVRPWKLIPVDVESQDITFDINFMQKMATNPALKNDPRMKKLAEKSFDNVSRMIQNLPKDGAPVTQMYSPSTGTVTTMMSPSSSSFMPQLTQPSSAVLTQTIPSRDPRMRDPRKKALAANPSSGSGQSSVLSLPMPPTLTSSNTAPAQPSPVMSMPTGSTNPKNLDEETLKSMVEQQIQMANQLAQQQQSQQATGDIDHRSLYAPSSSSVQPSLYAPITPRLPGSNDSPRADFGYGNNNSSSNSYRPPTRQPRYNLPNDSRPGNYYEEKAENYSPRWDNGFGSHGSPPNVAGGATSPPNQGQDGATGGSSTTAGDAPTSMREKRKNNVYASPLGRLAY